MAINKSKAQQQYIEIVVLNWNGKKDTLECLDSLIKINYKNFGITVADNGSTDGSVDIIRKDFPAINIIENGSNLGFAGGNNKAIELALKSDAKFILLLNNDTVVSPNILSAFVQASEQKPDGGIFGGKIYHYTEKNKIWYAGGYWDKKSLYFSERGAGQIDVGQFDHLVETEWVIGCAMFIRPEVFKKIGLLEHKFFLNNEEIDFCSRARRSGFSCIYVPDAKVWHKISVSFGGEDSPMKIYFCARNRLLWAYRNAGFVLNLRIYADTFLVLIQRFIIPSFKNPLSHDFHFKKWLWSLKENFLDPCNRAYFYGVRDYCLGHFGNCPEKIRDFTNVWSKKRKARP
ncbi:MAG: glycosyltransferase [Methylomarinum sp.]|nr:glycosyltransferase [Methylomarinum sp.]